MASDEEKPYMTSGEVARLLMVTITTVNRWLASGKLPHIRTPGGHYRVLRAEFMAMVQNGMMPVGGDKPVFRVMIVDDEAATVAMLREFVEKTRGLSVEVQTAADGLEAADRIPDFAPHLLLLDLMMPRMSGFELAGFARGHPATRDARIIIMTGFGSRENLSAAKKVGAHTIMTKPFSPVELRQAVLEAARDLCPEALVEQPEGVTR
jgi:excisionase family DNA binding protein